MIFCVTLNIKIMKTKFETEMPDTFDTLSSCGKRSNIDFSLHNFSSQQQMHCAQLSFNPNSRVQSNKHDGASIKDVTWVIPLVYFFNNIAGDSLQQYYIVSPINLHKTHKLVSFSSS